jgi:hypothetical protein
LAGLPDVAVRRFASRNPSAVLKAFRKSGLPENESGLTGPMIMKEYNRL